MTYGIKLVAGNWKMNGLRAEGLVLARTLAKLILTGGVGCELLVCPPATLLTLVGGALAGSGIALGGQDCHTAAAGAFTGSISAAMLKDAGCDYVILGHSERRHGCGESNSDVLAKTIAALQAGLVAIVCVGETREDRAAGKALDVVASQLDGSIPKGAAGQNLIVAYEPIWAIGTGEVPQLSEIAGAHSAIAARLPPATRVIYGGSVNTGNASGILRTANVDGVLVGNASLVADDFWTIASCYRPEGDICY